MKTLSLAENSQFCCLRDELVAALKLAKPWLSGLASYGPHTAAEVKPALDAARAALARAEQEG